MKLTPVTGTYAPTIESDTNGSFASYHIVPDTYTKVATFTSNTDFTIGSSLQSTYQAYIASTQPAGTYAGKVKYTMVHPNDAATPQVPVYMQDLTTDSIAALLPNTHDTAVVYDKRDDQTYTIAKLADGKYWMTENLNIAGGTALSSEDTDFDPSYELPTTNGWSVTDGKLFLPDSTTPWSNSVANYAFVYNSGNKENCGASGQSIPCYSYYTWDTVTLGSGRSLVTENTDAPYSICPKGWRLPTSGNWENNEWKRGDFYALATAYGSDFENSMYESSSTFYDNAGPNTIPNFLLSGMHNFMGSTSAGSSGGFWSSTASSDTSSSTLPVRLLSFYSNSSSIASMSNRQNGHSVRCLFKSD